MLQLTPPIVAYWTAPFADKNIRYLCYQSPETKFILDLQWPKKFAYYECWSVSACIPLESRIHAGYSRAGIHDRVMTIYNNFSFVFTTTFYHIDLFKAHKKSKKTTQTRPTELNEKTKSSQPLSIWYLTTIDTHPPHIDSAVNRHLTTINSPE